MTPERKTEVLLLVSGRGYLKKYDREAYGGRGFATYTGDPDKAKRFPSAHCARALLFAAPRCKPLRPDGKPNLPLTAYTTVTVPYFAAPKLMEPPVF